MLIIKLIQLFLIIFYKDSANERNESLISNCRVQPILYKDSANEEANANLFTTTHNPLVFHSQSFTVHREGAAVFRPSQIVLTQTRRLASCELRNEKIHPK